MERNSHPRFRPDINALRALAVVIVVLYHYEVPLLGGGYVGVDVFFVISGYLMAQMVLPRMKAGTFSLLDFYMARTRRIVPALLALVLALLAFGWFFMAPADLKALGKQAAASTTFLSNVMYWRDSGYFSPDAQENWLLHTWSLSVEWQFYALFPLVVALEARSRRAYSGAILAVVFLLSLAASFAATPLAAKTSFYLLPTRAWELLLGSLTFAFRDRLGLFRNTATASVGLGLVLASAVFFTKYTPFPGYLALIPTLGTALFILSEVDWSVVRHPVPQLLGTISYSLYLWHWPVLLASNYLGLPERTGFTTVPLVLSVVMAYGSYRIIETPFRRNVAKRSQRRSAAAYSALVTGICAACLLVFVGNGGFFALRGVKQQPLTDQLLRYANEYDYTTPWRRGRCLMLPEQDYTELQPECFQTGRDKDAVLLWGDSHAAHLYPVFKSGSTSVPPVAELTASACPPLVGYFVFNRPHCAKINETILQWIKEARPNTVILAAFWLTHTREMDLQENIGKTVAVLRSYGVRNIVLVGPVPAWTGHLPLRIYRDLYESGTAAQRSWRGILKDGVALDSIMKNWADALGISYVSIVDILCDSGGCLRYLQQGTELVPVQWDDTHLTVAGAELVAPVLTSAVRPALPDAGRD